MNWRGAESGIEWRGGIRVIGCGWDYDWGIRRLGADAERQITRRDNNAIERFGRRDTVTVVIGTVELDEMEKKKIGLDFLIAEKMEINLNKLSF